MYGLFYLYLETWKETDYSPRQATLSTERITEAPACTVRRISPSSLPLMTYDCSKDRDYHFRSVGTSADTSGDFLYK